MGGGGGGGCIKGEGIRGGIGVIKIKGGIRVILGGY